MQKILLFNYELSSIADQPSQSSGPTDDIDIEKQRKVTDSAPDAAFAPYVASAPDVASACNCPAGPPGPPGPAGLTGPPGPQGEGLHLRAYQISVIYQFFYFLFDALLTHSITTSPSYPGLVVYFPYTIQLFHLTCSINWCIGAMKVHVCTVIYTHVDRKNDQTLLTKHYHYCTSTDICLILHFAYR